MCLLVPNLNCVKMEDYLLVPVTIHTICMVLFIPTKTVGTHAATCDRVVLVFIQKAPKTRIEFRQGSIGTITSSLAMLHNV